MSAHADYSSKSKSLTIAVALFSFAILLLSMPRNANIFDEGIILSDAMRVLQGDILHSDFYSNYGPGQYYVLAGIFKVVGENFMAERLYDLVVRSAVLSMLFFIIYKQCRFSIALMFTAVGGMWFFGNAAAYFFLYPIIPCLLLSLIGSYLLTRVGQKPVISVATIGAGACTGLSALFRYDVGFLILVAHLFSIVALISLSDAEGPRGRRIVWSSLVYSLGIAVVFVPAAIALILVSPSVVSGFLFDVLGYGLKVYPVMRALPFPGLQFLVRLPHEAAVYLPLLAVGLAFWELIFFWRHRKTRGLYPPCNASIAYLIVFGSTTCLLFLQGVVRVQASHMLPAIVNALVVFAILANLWSRRGTLMRSAAVIIVVLSLLPAASTARDRIAKIRYEKESSIVGWLALGAGLFRPTEDNECEATLGLARLGSDYTRVAIYLLAHTRPSERIFIALDRHDKIFVNAPFLYFATKRLPGTHWHQFDPGLQTRADIQDAIISDLQRNKVRWIVRDGNYDDVTEPNGSAQSSGVTLLDQYIEKNYRVIASSGNVAIWLANGETPPNSVPINKCEATPVHMNP